MIFTTCPMGCGPDGCSCDPFKEVKEYAETFNYQAYSPQRKPNRAERRGNRGKSGKWKNYQN